MLIRSVYINITYAALIITALISVFIMGCRSYDPEIRNESIFIHLSAEPDTLNPVTATDAYASRINSYVYETLVDRDYETLEIVPLLAESWDISPDKLTYRFYLRRGVTWHDGREFTADDVVYSYEVLMDPDTLNAHLKAYFIDIKKVEKIDRYTVEFTYRERYFLGLEICGTMPIVPRHIFDDGTDFNTHRNNRFPIGTGPYRFIGWDTGKRVILELNENYWGRVPDIKRLVFILVSESNVAFQMLKKGDLDLYAMRPIQWERQTGTVRFNEQFRKLKYSLPQYSYIGWNAQSELFSDRRVRLAMTHLINREAILEKLLFGLGEMVTGTHYIYSPYYNSDMKPWPYDPGAAKRLLEEAGWDSKDQRGILTRNGKRFSFTFTIPSGSTFAERLATIMKEDFSRHGIHMNIARYEWAVFIDRLQSRDFEAVTLAWSLGYAGDPYQLWHSSQAEAGSNYVSFKNSEADRLIEMARREFNHEKRKQMYHRFHEILHHEQPYTFLYANPQLMAVSRRFSNVNVYLKGLDLTEWGIIREQ